MTWVLKVKHRVQKNTSLLKPSAHPAFATFGTFDSIEDLDYQAASATVWVHFHVDVLINYGGD